MWIMDKRCLLIKFKRVRALADFVQIIRQANEVLKLDCFVLLVLSRLLAVLLSSYSCVHLLVVACF